LSQVRARIVDEDKRIKNFYNDFDNLIDREAPEEKWLFDYKLQELEKPH